VKAKAAPWLFPEGSVFPVVKPEDHPLKRFGRRLLIWGIVIAGLLHLGAFGGWLIARSMKPAPPAVVATLDIIKHVKSAQDLGVPPSISQTDAVDAQAAVAVASAPSIGVPEPVPDFQATTTTLATTEQIAEALTPVDVSDLRSGSDSLVVDESMFNTQGDAVSDINAVEELPVPINTPAPVYPDLARSGEVEGDVVVQALITREGKVSDVKVVDGNWVLHDAAITAVKKWTFKPALQQHKPVSVWVEIPLHFTLD
jgi:TonB family protein